MNDATFVADRAVQAQLDRLAAGDLPEGERRSLLAWLDEEPRRWRACAVTFLEAQSWENAIAAWPAGGAQNALGREVPTARSARRPEQAYQFRYRQLALAAIVLAAFFSGAVLARFAPAPILRQTPTVIQRPDSTPGGDAHPDFGDQPLLATVSVRTNLDPQVPAQLQVPVAPWNAAEEALAGISDYERKQWERRGFELSEERRYLPARLPDGREVVVPVNKVHLKFKGTPVS